MKNPDIAQLQRDIQALRTISNDKKDDGFSRSRYCDARNNLKYKKKQPSVNSAKERSHQIILKMSGKSFTEFLTQILNLCVLTLTSLIPISHPHQNVSLEQHLNQQTTCGHLSTLYLMILNVHSIFEKSAIVKSWVKYILCAQTARVVLMEFL